MITEYPYIDCLQKYLRYIVTDYNLVCCITNCIIKTKIPSHINYLLKLTKYIFSLYV